MEIGLCYKIRIQFCLASKWEFVNDSFIVFFLGLFTVGLKQNSNKILFVQIYWWVLLMTKKYCWMRNSRVFRQNVFFFIYDKLLLYIWQLHQVRAKFVARFKFLFDCPVMKKGEDKWSWIKNVIVILSFKLILFICLFCFV